MFWINKLHFLVIQLFLVKFAWSEEAVIVRQHDGVSCQYKSTEGRDYRGKANTTVTGKQCKMWSDTSLLAGSLAHLGEHNYCRNPVGTLDTQVWCFSPDYSPEKCSVPFCPSLNVLDFSLDNDWKPDVGGSYSHASVWRFEVFPLSFTICSAFTLEYWGMKSINSPLFLIKTLDEIWLYVELIAYDINTQFVVRFSGEDFTLTSSSIFFPMQWTRVCFSYDSDSYMASMAVNGYKLQDRTAYVDPLIGMVQVIIGWGGSTQESPGRFTNINIFSTPLANMSEMFTTAGDQHCGAPGDYLNWEETEWTLHSQARVIELDSARGPCRNEPKMHVYPMSDYHSQSYCMQHCEKMNGRSQSVRTFEEWQAFADDVQQIEIQPMRLPDNLWLSATEGDKYGNLSTLDHWPEGIKAVEGVWRDFYTAL